MAGTDPRIDVYIERAAPFAQPILALLRSAAYGGCPAVVETIKWSMPFYMHAERILANMAAFRQHCSFRFWNGREAAERGKSMEAMGEFSRIATLRDLPPRRELVLVVKQAVALIDAGGTGNTRTVEANQRGASAQTPPCSAAAPSSRNLNRCAVSERIAIFCKRGGTSS